jgi:tetratricopeptide (TPR) repeat protein
MSKRASVIVALVSVALVPALVGCQKKTAEKPTFPDAAVSATSKEAPTNAEVLTPLPRIAEEHPAPEGISNLDQAETAVADKPDDPQRNLQLAFTYYRNKAYADAARAFDKASQLLPKDPQPLLYLGYTQMAVGALDSAITTFERVLAMKEIDRNILSEAHLQIGNARGALGDSDKAIAAFTQAIGNNPKNGLASLALGGWAAQNNRLDQARDFFTDAANDLPSGRHKAQAHAGLGRLAEGRKDTKTAIVEYKKAIALDSENEWAKEGLARLPQKQADARKDGKKKS